MCSWFSVLSRCGMDWTKRIEQEMYGRVSDLNIFEQAKRVVSTKLKFMVVLYFPMHTIDDCWMGPGLFHGEKPSISWPYDLLDRAWD